MERKKQDNKNKPLNFSTIKLLPQAVELEEIVLGGLMIDPNIYETIKDILIPESFYKIEHQLIYTAITKLGICQKPIDILTVTGKLKEMGKLEETGGLYYITQLSNKISSTAHLEYHARIIAEKFKARKLLTLLSKSQTKIFDETYDIENLISEIYSELNKISSTVSKDIPIQINSVIEEAYGFLQKAASRTDGISGLESGFYGLDKMTSGWQNGDLITISGRPGMGKTAFILSMIKNIAVDSKNPVVLFSLDMTNIQVINRLIVNVCEIPGEKIKSGQLAPYEWGQLDYRIKELIDAPIYIDNNPYCRINDLCNKARYLVRNNGVKLIVIDYIQLLYQEVKYSENRYLELNYFTRRLKSLAKELNVPIIIISQMNRSNESREGAEGKRPQLTDLRDSGTLCDDSDMVLFIYRPEYYKIFQDDKGNDMRGHAEIIIAKHRNGAVGDVLLRFSNEYARFNNLDDDIIVPLP